MSGVYLKVLSTARTSQGEKKGKKKKEGHSSGGGASMTLWLAEYLYWRLTAI